MIHDVTCYQSICSIQESIRSILVLTIVSKNTPMSNDSAYTTAGSSGSDWFSHRVLMSQIATLLWVKLYVGIIEKDRFFPMSSETS